MKSGTTEKAEVHRERWITASKATPATCVGRVGHAQVQKEGMAIQHGRDWGLTMYIPIVNYGV